MITNMKKTLLTLFMTLSLTTAMMAAPQTDSVTAADSTDEVELYSDTLSAADAANAADGWDDGWDDEWDDEWNEEWSDDDFSPFFNGIHASGVDFNDMFGVFMVICVVFIIFILAPVAIIGLILYFVYKNRKDRMRVMEMALKNGKQIPLDVMGTPCPKTDDLWNKGIKQMFLGAGLGFLLWVVIGKLGLAIGVLVLLIGCGNMVIAHNARQKQQERDLHDRMFGRKDNEE